ncbi:MAG: aquaporin family protein [Anaerolineae bacterium]|nr:aquaporin family protein [Anaerolineae bacterium]
MNLLMAELVGTMILILLGDGVVANVVLSKNKGEGGGGGGAWIVITAGWGFAVAVAVYITGWVSGAHINPAVTIGLVSIGSLDVGSAFLYIIGQFIGAFLGAVLVFIAYYDHFKATDDPGLKLAVFSTGPAIRNTPMNLITEIIGTAMLLIGVLGITNANNGLGSGITPYLVGILVFSIGLSLGGPTGYAINPARDLGPRIAHAVLPIPGKGSSDWEYSWIPVVGPIIGGILGCMLYQFLFLPMWGG